MEIRLFKPVKTELITKLYAEHLIRIVSDEASKTAFQLELTQLRMALEHRGIDTRTIAPTPLETDELNRVILAVRDCYRDAASVMTDEELEAYYVRLTLFGIKTWAEPIEEEMNKRGLTYSSPDAIRSARTDLEEAAEAEKTHRQVVDESLHSFIIDAYRARKDPNYTPTTPLVN